MTQSKIYITEAKPQASFLQRLWIYQKERFPIFKHAILIGTFTFSAIGYTRMSRGATGFIPWGDYLAGVFLTFTLFLLLRIADEFKDKEDDKKYRAYLPVPRGLISLKELKVLAIATIGLQLLLVLFLQAALWKLYVIVLAYLLLMRVEFFVPEWLKKQPILYMASHMMIIPLVDCLASGLDWVNNGVSAPTGLVFFFLVSFLNGIVLEFGRKIRTPQMEEPGVQSYTSLYGTKRAVVYWLMVLALTATASVLAARFAGFNIGMQMVFPGVMLLASIPAISFLMNPTEKAAKGIENSSGLWTLAMYLFLGGLPMLLKII